MNGQLKGKLQLIVMFLLSKEELNGYDLIKKVSPLYGKRPSTGTIYPLLVKLNKEGYTDCSQDGRSVTYSLNKSGKECYKNLAKESKEYMEDFKYLLLTMGIIKR